MDGWQPVADRIVFQPASPARREASYITGQDILVDGGLVAAYPQ